MLIPYSTDAPIYHLPIATVGAIVANVAVFVGITSLSHSMDEEDFERLVQELMLAYGNGLRPWQWITSNFMHADIMHLLGNMFCLWGFGLVVEGKVGWWRFLLIFFGIGITQCAMEQTLTLFSDGGFSLGASSIVYGLLAVALVWAPQNEMSCCFFILFRVIMFDVTIYTLAGISIFVEAFTGMFAGLQITSQLLHLMGAGMGFAIGVVMLKKNWVDCEGWDLFNVWQGREYKARDDEKEAAEALLKEAHERHLKSLAEPADATPSPAVNSFSFPMQGTAVATAPLAPDSLMPTEDPSLGLMRAEIANGAPQTAFEHYQQFTSDPLNWPLPERELLQIIGLYHKQQQWSSSVPAMVEYLRSFTDKATQVRLKLGHVLLEADKRPAQAWKVLSKIDVATLSDKDKQLLQKLRQRAKQLHATTPKEAPVQDW